MQQLEEAGSLQFYWPGGDLMLRLVALFYIIIAPTLAGIFALVPLTMSGTLSINAGFLLAFVIAGAVLALPVSWFVAKRIDALFSSKGPAASV